MLNHTLNAQSTLAMTSVLAHWNTLSVAEAAAAILPCCGSRAWADSLARSRPIADETLLLARSDAAWFSLSHEDWQQAFDSHPRLGEGHARAATAESLDWSKEEQKQAAPSDELRDANARYEKQFGHIFLFCASGRTAPEIVEALNKRMHNDARTEWLEAGEQQRQITHLRLKRWLKGESA